MQNVTLHLSAKRTSFINAFHFTASLTTLAKHSTMSQINSSFVFISTCGRRLLRCEEEGKVVHTLRTDIVTALKRGIRKQKTGL